MQKYQFPLTLPPELSSFVIVFGFFENRTELPLLAFASSDTIAATLVLLPLLACEWTSLASKLLALIVLPLLADVSSFSAFPLALMVLPLEVSKVKLSASTSTSMELPLDDFTFRLVDDNTVLLSIFDPLLAFNPLITGKLTLTFGEPLVLYPSLA